MDKNVLSVVHRILSFSFIMGSLLSIIGTYWDIQYHIDVGRDSFWITPHLVIYSGILMVFLSSIFSFAYAWKLKNRKAGRRILFAIGFMFGSVLLQLGAAPVDDLWHRLFGLDVTVWSPPHLLLIFAGFFILLSAIFFERTYAHLSGIEHKGFLASDEAHLEILFAVALVGLNIILAEFEYFRTIPLYHLSQLRDPALYLALLSFQFSFVFALAKAVIGNRPFAIKRISLL
jgi:hypothetical protein